ncbi:MAG: helix-turn-helix domain-containing protein, partial [Spirochaetales bacterium]|nr:helix-turn-helix domain-containing protein [Candidatus Physcosoma equi]
LHSNQPFGYGDSFKLEVVHCVLQGMPKEAAATKYNMTAAVIRSWLKKFGEGGEKALLEDNRGRHAMGRKPKPKLSDYEPGSIEYLKLENEMLRRENLLLKKALPLIQESERRTLRGKKSTETSGN